MEKTAGILLPLFSAPGNQGIGDLGQKTLMLIDAIADAGYSYWALTPLAPTSHGRNPYESVSSYAGDPIYINIDRLSEMGLLTQSSIVNCNKFKEVVDYDTVRAFKEPYFIRAFKAFKKKYADYRAEFEAFKKQAFWLNFWTAYEVFRQSYNGIGWHEWEEEYRNWPEKQEINLREYIDKIFYVQFLQFIFYKQFQEVVDHARKKNLKLIIDVPYFLNLDNAEVWANKNEFMVTSEGTIAEFAGTPSDIYYPLGQKWDIPVYNMETMQKNDYKIIRDRFRWYARFYDGVRLLHFKFIDVLWRIPAGKEARLGHWTPGPGKYLLNLIQEDNPNLMIIAEDQGQTRPSLNELEDELNIPGMDILQYRMETKLLKKPSKERSVVYTSTPDTPTMEEDYLSYDNNKRIALRRFFKKRNYSHRTFHDLVCHYAIDSDARLVLVNLADLVGAKQPISLSTISPEGELVDWSWKLKDFKVFPSELKKSSEWLMDSGRHSSLQNQSLETEKPAE